MDFWIKICYYLKNKKVYKRKSRGTNELLFIDRMIMRELKMRKQNLSMAWIGYKKIYDMAPKLSIINCLEKVGMNERIRRLLCSYCKWN